MGMHATTAPLLCTETKTSSLRRNYHHRLYWKLSFWQPPVRPATKIASVHERYGNTVTSITPCQCSLMRLLLRPPGPQSVIKGLPQHSGHPIADFSFSIVATNQSPHRISAIGWLLIHVLHLYRTVFKMDALLAKLLSFWSKLNALCSLLGRMQSRCQRRRIHGLPLLCRDSDTLRRPKKSSSTGQVALRYFNRFFFQFIIYVVVPNTILCTIGQWY